MQSLRVRRSIPVHHSKWPDLDPHGVYDQDVAFVMAHGIAIPGRRRLCRMRRIHPHVTDLMIVAIKNGDLVRLLDQLSCATRKNERHPSGPTLVAGVGSPAPLS